jgi:hypothetical protein
MVILSNLQVRMHFAVTPIASVLWMHPVMPCPYIHTYIHTYIYTYIRTYIHPYPHVHTYVHTYITTNKWQNSDIRFLCKHPITW